MGWIDKMQVYVTLWCLSIALAGGIGWYLNEEVKRRQRSREWESIQAEWEKLAISWNIMTRAKKFIAKLKNDQN